VKILFYDIETTPLKVWTFSAGRKAYIHHGSVVEGSYEDIICAAWKWGHEKKVHCMDWGLQKQNSSKLVLTLSKELEEADLIVGHNADKFDWRMLNTLRLRYGLPSINWELKSEDTLKQMRKYFKLPYYNLDYLTSTLGVGKKGDMCLQDWVNIIDHKDSKSLDKMVKYCKNDVLVLQKLYERIKPYLKPKLNMYKTQQERVCPVCGSIDTVRNGTRVINGKVFQQYHCKGHNGYAGRVKIGLI
jgi:uncharacterized protein YprB with RNaseH-like and TPR domain